MDILKTVRDARFTLAIVGVLTVVATVLVIYGVATHTEPGLDDDMPRWERAQMPLAVCVFSYAETETQPQHTRTAHAAIEIINQRLGFNAYELRYDDACNVLLRFGEPVEPGWIDPGGNAYVDTYGICHAATSNVHGEIEFLVVQHELGHCLGLAHDDFERSIMRAVQDETPDRHLPPWISDFDRSLLRDLYGPR